MKQYFFLVTELVNGKLTPLKITLQSYNAVKFGRTYAEKQARTALSVASGSKAVMQIVYSAWYAYEHDNITEDFVMIEGSFV